MTNNEIKTLAQGKYAMQRREVLENHAPEMYERMQADGTLEEHLADIQERVSDYVELNVERYKQRAEYKEIQAVNPFEAARLLNMTVLEAENAAYRSWIASVPENDEDEEDYEDEGDDDE